MTQDEIIEMARAAGICSWLKPPKDVKERLEAFAKLVADKVTAIEREACAKVCEDIEAQCIAEDSDDPPLQHIASAIRARGEQA